jgi:hypothetical protein
MSYNSLPKKRELPTLTLDFDGVVHDYMEGWKDGKIYGKPTVGFFKWAAEAKKHFKLVIFSSRSAESHKGITPMVDWLTVHLWDFQLDNPGVELTIKDFEFSKDKPRSFIAIDDRALLFTGKWEDFKPEELIKFEPWNSQKGK